jgi:hypothetical protein
MGEEILLCMQLKRRHYTLLLFLHDEKRKGDTMRKGCIFA